MKRRVDLALAVGLLVSLAFNGALLLRDRSSAAAPAPASTRSASGARSSPCPPAALASRPQEPSASHGDPAMGRDRRDFDDEVRDPAWATAQEAAIEGHIAEMVREPRDIAVECRARCCAITGKDALSPDFVLDLQTSAGLVRWADGLSFSDRVVACFDRAAARPPPTELARRRNQPRESGPESARTMP